MHLAHLSQQIKHIQMEDCVFHYNSELKQSKSFGVFFSITEFLSLFYHCSVQSHHWYFSSSSTLTKRYSYYSNHSHNMDIALIFLLFSFSLHIF